MPSRKQKRIEEYNRKKAFREPRKSMLIVCEGKKTEPIYFNKLKRKLKLAMVDIEIVGIGAVPITVVNRAVELKREKRQAAKKSPTEVEYDVIYCVIDVEAPEPHESLAEAINKAQDNKLEVVLSNPCFEYWYILHFRKTGAPFNTSRDVKSELRRRYHPNYDESDETIFDAVYPNTNNAIRHSREVLREQHDNAADLRDCNPSTNVHRIVECLKAQC